MSENSSHARLSSDERQELLDMYDGLRVADVVDGLDYHGFHDVNQMSSDVAPLYRDIDGFSHQITGFAYTVRYLPTNKRRELPNPAELDFETSSEWAWDWWDDYSPDPSTDDIREDDVLVVEAHDLSVGILGSMNLLTAVDAGAVGVVTDGGPRDTDEVIKQGIPVYSTGTNKTIPPGRVELDAEQVPVSVGGCQVRPADIVVADGDGVVVVPIEYAEEVAETARGVLEIDQKHRRDYYEKVGLEPDFTLE